MEDGLMQHHLPFSIINLQSPQGLLEEMGIALLPFEVKMQTIGGEVCGGVVGKIGVLGVGERLLDGLTGLFQLF